jgi:hypothetical protein
MARKLKRPHIENLALNHVHKKVYAVDGGCQQQDIGQDEAHQPPAIPVVEGGGGGGGELCGGMSRSSEGANEVIRLKNRCTALVMKAAPRQLAAVLPTKRWAQGAAQCDGSLDAHLVLRKHDQTGPNTA